MDLIRLLKEAVVRLNEYDDFNMLLEKASMRSTKTMSDEFRRFIISLNEDNDPYILSNLVVSAAHLSDEEIKMFEDEFDSDPTRFNSLAVSLLSRRELSEEHALSIFKRLNRNGVAYDGMFIRIARICVFKSILKAIFNRDILCSSRATTDIDCALAKNPNTTQEMDILLMERYRGYGLYHVLKSIQDDVMAKRSRKTK